MTAILKHHGKELVQVFLGQQALAHLELIRQWYSKRDNREMTDSEIIEGLILAHLKRTVIKNIDRKHEAKVRAQMEKKPPPTSHVVKMPGDRVG